MRKKSIELFVIGALISFVLVISGCSKTLKDYYSETTNYVSAVATVESVHYNEDLSAIYLNFVDTTPTFDDKCFKIVGDNVQIVTEKDFISKVQAGDQIHFITAPRYFGDGYIMPIVSISIDGEEILDFDRGYYNLLKWLD